MKGALLQAVFLLLLGQAIAQDNTTVAPHPSEPKEISYEELATGLANFTVVDIRSRSDVIKDGMIPGSHIVPLGELESSLALSEEDFLAKYGFHKMRKDDPSFVLTCRTPGKVHEGNAILVAHGYTKHRLYLGSFLDWVDNGGDITKPGKPFEPANTNATVSAPHETTSAPESATANSTIPKEFIIF